MSALSLPPGGPTHAANAIPGELAGQRNAAGRHGAGKDGSAFGALLGALDEAAAPTHPVANSGGATAPQTARSTEAATLASSLLAADGAGRDKSPGATAKNATSHSSEAKSGNDASTLSPLDASLAQLLLGASGPAATPSPPKTSASAPNAPSPKTPALNAPARIGDSRVLREPLVDTSTWPSESAPAPLTRAAAPNVGGPVDAAVVRSVTYLGLDPTNRIAGERNPPSAGTTVSTSSTAGGTDAKIGDAAPDIVSAPGSPNADSGGASTQTGHDRGGASSNASGFTRVDPPVATDTAMTAAPDASPAGNPAAVIQVTQLAGFVADAAATMDQPAPGSPAADGPAVAAARSAPVKELEVQLNPKSLGALSIQMRLSNGAMSVTIAAGNPDTLKLVSGQSRAISDRLESLDFSVANITVKPMDAPASAGASHEAPHSGMQGHGEAREDQSGQAASGSSRGGQSFPSGGERRSARPERGGRAEAGGDPGHRFV